MNACVNISNIQKVDANTYNINRCEIEFEGKKAYTYISSVFMGKWMKIRIHNSKLNSFLRKHACI